MVPLNRMARLAILVLCHRTDKWGEEGEVTLLAGSN